LRAVLLWVQILFISLFLAALVASFFTVDLIKEKSRDAVTEKVVHSLTAKVAFAEEVLNSKAAPTFLAPYQIDTLRDEIARYKNDPFAYVEAMTKDETTSRVTPPQTAGSSPLQKSLMEKVVSWKMSIKHYFDKTFEGLVIDLRIFLLSNVIALAVGAFVGIRTRLLGDDGMLLNIILTGVVALSSLFYIDKNWFFTILLNNYSGYGYPFTVLLMTGWLYYHALMARTSANS